MLVSYRVGVLLGVLASLALLVGTSVSMSRFIRLRLRMAPLPLASSFGAAFKSVGVCDAIPDTATFGL